MTRDAPTILLTAFEPSGDEHAAAAIAALRRLAPEARLLAWGGPRMRDAGAELVRQTCDNAAMGVPGVGKILHHIRLHREFKRWIKQHRLDAHVPVDSPAANTPMCKATKRLGVRVAHLVAPQMWAWAPWRVHRLRRLTDCVLCLLPFEPAWFEARGVPAEFIGHPLFDEPLAGESLDARVAALSLPEGSPRLALMPGSRPAELRANFPVMLEAFRALKRDRPGVVGVVAAVSEEAAKTLRGLAEARGGWPEGLALATAATPAVICWCDVAVAVSGTVTLHIARQRKPMLVMFRMPRLTGWIARRLIINARFIALPNVFAGRRIVPELFPYTGGPERLIGALSQLLDDVEGQAAQRQALDRLCAPYEIRSAGEAAARAILALVSGDGAAPPPWALTPRAISDAALAGALEPESSLSP